MDGGPTDTGGQTKEGRGDTMDGTTGFPKDTETELGLRTEEMTDGLIG